MPEYVYKCSNEECGIEFSFIQGINDIACAQCPECVTITKERIPQLFSCYNMTPRTLGQLADYNRKHMSEAHYGESVQKMANDRKKLSQYCGKIPEGSTLKDKSEFKEMPWTKDTLPIEKINKMDAGQKKDYVLHGKVPIGLG